MQKVAILQSCYLPWRGYFDIIGSVDTFVIYDDVQYTKNHWHNRNQIKTQHGLKWLTVPVLKPESGLHNIEDVRVDGRFAINHWKTISQSYSKAAYFRDYRDWVGSLFESVSSMGTLSEVNIFLLKEISLKLGLSTNFVMSREFGREGSRTGRLVRICEQLGATNYLSGPSARAYLEVEEFRDAGIDVSWVNYGGYPQYGQIHGAFEPAVSIIDLIFNAGPDARKYMKS